jgi:hypothetical protein
MHARDRNVVVPFLRDALAASALALPGENPI